MDEAGTDAARNVLHELQSQLSVEPTGLPVSGTMLGEYRLLREIGRGGMGVIFEAEQTSVPGRRVAIKLLARSAASELRLNRFRREIEVIGRLDHMNIVPILSADLSGEEPWYAMKLVLGRTLRELLDDGELFDFGQMASIFRELAWALDHAHCKGVVHRDVNARNIMLDAQGKAQLLDFGLAHDDLSQTVLTLGDDALGTAEYMSPEQVSGRGGDICPATDVYGLGATLYRCLCGRPPFSGRTLHEVFERILAGHPTALRKLRPDVPPDLAAICLQAMAPDIGSRYESAGEMAQDLTAFLEYGPVHARSPGFVRRGLRMVRQHRGVALVTAIALLFAAGVWLEGSWWTPRRLLSMQDVAARAGDLDQVTQLSQRLHEDFAQTSFAEEGQGVQSRLIRSKIDDGLAALSERIARDDLADEALALAYDELSGLGAAGLAHEGL
ncbi:MAG: serine/threonine protein kinase, partial [Pseudohongiellaceae bacterium]